MYGLNCPYYNKEFETLEELLDDIIISGMDPNYRIIYTHDNGKVVDLGSTAWEHIEPYI